MQAQAQTISEQLGLGRPRPGGEAVVIDLASPHGYRADPPVTPHVIHRREAVAALDMFETACSQPGEPVPWHLGIAAIAHALLAIGGEDR